jgi:hypothetical protein
MAYVPTMSEPIQLTVPQPVLLWAAPPARQRRVISAFRVVLAVPHLVILYFLGIAVGVVAFIGWFGALVTGRLPGFAREFVSGYLGWACRVGAYMLLLTDSYPPFDFTDGGRYPAQLAIPPADTLNRLAVFFRLLLAIPAWFLGIFLIYGTLAVIAPVGWLIALIGGRLPAPVHQAFTAVLRYQAHFEAYLLMVVPAYPSDAFGDTRVPDTAAGSWMLPVGKGAKRLLILTIALGVVAFVSLPVIDITFQKNKIDAIFASNRVIAAYNALTGQLTATETAQTACEQNGQELSCLRTSDKARATSLSTFATAIGAISVPADATAQAKALEQNAAHAAEILTQLSEAGTSAQYNSIYDSSGLTGYLSSVDSETQQLQQTLRDYA